MSRDGPLRFQWDERNGVWYPLDVRACRQRYMDKQFVTFTEFEPRSRDSHSHYFASVNDMWNNLPDDLRQDFKTAEQLRKHALIMTNWHHSRVIVCSSKSVAREMAVAMRGALGEYRVISVHGKTVVELIARSQKMTGAGAMGKRDFQKSKDDVMAWIANLLDVDVEVAKREAGRSA
jgi:hypothetical protein